jgi:hypothetical protein
MLDIANSDTFRGVILAIEEWMGLDNIVFCPHKELEELNVIKTYATELHWRALAL